MPLYPNWKRICQIKNAHLRMAMYTATGGELGMLQIAFPRCFSRRRKNLCVPASLVRDEAAIYSIETFADGSYVAIDREMSWIEAADRLNIPIAYSWSFEPDDTEDLFPDEVWEQLEGKPLRCGKTIDYKGETFMVISLLNRNGDEEIDGIVTRENNPWIHVVHAHFIDLDG